MTSDLQHLLAKAGSYGGQGVDTVAGAFHGELELIPLRSGRAVMVRFAGFTRDGTRVHDQLGWLASDGADGVSLWRVEDEGRVVHKLSRRFGHDATGSDCTLAFACGDPADPAQLRAETAFDLYGDGSIGLRLEWRRPGDSGSSQATVRLSATFSPPAPPPF